MLFGNFCVTLSASGTGEIGFNELGFEHLYLCCVDTAQMFRIFQSSQKKLL
jgi:hypothetical protein